MALYQPRYLQQPTDQDRVRGGLLFTREQYANTKRDLQEKVLIGADDEEVRILQIDPTKVGVEFDANSNKANRTNRAGTTVENSNGLKKRNKNKYC